MCYLFAVGAGVLSSAAFSLTFNARLTTNHHLYLSLYPPFFFATIYGFAAGTLFSPCIVWALHNGAIGDAVRRALLPTILVSMFSGLIGMFPHFATLGAAVCLITICRVSSKLSPAVLPMDLLSCYSCGYNLKGVQGKKCPECGEERIVPQASTPAMDDRA